MRKLQLFSLTTAFWIQLLPAFSAEDPESYEELMARANAVATTGNALAAEAAVSLAFTSAKKNNDDKQIAASGLMLAQLSFILQKTNAASDQLDYVTQRMQLTKLPQLYSAGVLGIAGQLNLKLWRLPEALKSLQLAYDRTARKLGPYHPSSSYIQGHLGVCQLALGDNSSAARNLRDAVTSLQQVHMRPLGGEWVGVTRIHRDNYNQLLAFISDYANLLRRQGKLRYEGNRLKEFLSLTETMYATENAGLVPILVRLGYNYEARMSPSTAEKHFAEAERIAEINGLDLRTYSLDSRVDEESFLNMVAKLGLDLKAYRLDARIHHQSFLKRQGKNAAAERISKELRNASISEEDAEIRLNRNRKQLHTFTFER